MAGDNPLSIYEGLRIGQYDYVALSYTGSNATTITYKIGGSSGTIVAVLALTYDGSNNLTSVTKTT